MKVAVDVCIGTAAVKLLGLMGHEVVAAAVASEPDGEWFARGLRRGAEVFISADVDIAILCYDANVALYRPRQGVKSKDIVAEFQQWLQLGCPGRQRMPRLPRHARRTA